MTNNDLIRVLENITTDINGGRYGNLKLNIICNKKIVNKEVQKALLQLCEAIVDNSSSTIHASWKEAGVYLEAAEREASRAEEKAGQAESLAADVLTSLRHLRDALGGKS